MKVLVVVYNPTEVKQLIIVNMLTIWKNWILRNMLNVQNSPDVETPETAGQVSYLSGSQSNQEMMMNDDVAGNETAGEL